MKWALDTGANKLVTLPMLWDLRAEIIQPLLALPKADILIRAALNENLVCPECRNPVHVFAVGRINGFNLAGRHLTEPREQAKMGFQHYAPDNKRNNGVKNVRECSLYWPDDPRFENLDDKNEDPAIGERIRQVLVSPSVKKQNFAVLAELHRQAAQSVMSQKDLSLYIRIAQKYFMKHEVFASHPYILPYAVMGMVPYFTRQGRFAPYRVKFIERGDHELLYRDIEGKDRSARVPEYLTLAIRKGRYWQPMTRDDKRFPITEAASRALIGWDERVVQTTLISVPKSLIGAPVSSENPSSPLLLPGMDRWMGLHNRYKNG